MTDGYIYCFSNLSMPNILKIGMTERTPNIRLKEANRSDTWKPPTPYKIELAKKVINPKQKETTLHSLLSKYAIRTNPKREFFQISIEEVKIFFDLIDGELWFSDKEEELKELEEKINRISIINKSLEILNEYDNTYYHKEVLKLLKFIIINISNIEFNNFYYKYISLFNVEYYHYYYNLNNFKNNNLLNLYNTPNDFIKSISDIFNYKFSSKYYKDLYYYVYIRYF